jgi:hypothetical protein
MSYSCCKIIDGSSNVNKIIGIIIKAQCMLCFVVPSFPLFLVGRFISSVAK